MVDKEDDQGPSLGALYLLPQVPKALERRKIRAVRRGGKATLGGNRRLDADPLRPDALKLRQVGRDLRDVPAIAVQLVHAVPGRVVNAERRPGVGLGGER